MRTIASIVTVAIFIGSASSFAPPQSLRISKSCLSASTLDETQREEPKLSLRDRITNSGAASAAALATAAVNAAVSMKTLEAPDISKSYISLDRSDGSKNALDEEGLPLMYDKNLIELYWSKERGALNQRWAYFVGKAVPFFTKMITLFIRDGKISEKEIPQLSKQAREDLQDLGPALINVGPKDRKSVV